MSLLFVVLMVVVVVVVVGVVVVTGRSAALQVVAPSLLSFENNRTVQSRRSRTRGILMLAQRSLFALSFSIPYMIVCAVCFYAPGCRREPPAWFPCSPTFLCDGVAAALHVGEAHPNPGDLRSLNPPSRCFSAGKHLKACARHQLQITHRTSPEA